MLLLRLLLRPLLGCEAPGTAHHALRHFLHPCSSKHCLDSSEVNSTAPSSLHLCFKSIVLMQDSCTWATGGCCGCCCSSDGRQVLLGCLAAGLLLPLWGLGGRRRCVLLQRSKQPGRVQGSMQG
jgi:hypothetical protein